MWDYLNLLSVPCNELTPGPVYYTGVNAGAAYNTTNCPIYSAYPLIETNTGSPGSDCGHWAESNYNTELMTPFAEVFGTNMPISVFTIGAMDDIWGSVNYAEADPFTCSPPSLLAASAQEDDWILLKPVGGIMPNGTMVPYE